jgi:hypothetical protein
MITVTLPARMLACWAALALSLFLLAGCASSSSERDADTRGSGGCSSCGR